MSSYTRIQLEDWLKTIEIKNGRVLDCGGSQNPLSKNRLKVFEPDEYKILDLEQPHNCKQVPDIKGDLNIPECDYPSKKCDKSLNEVFLLKKNYFDVIFCLEVAEYWWNPNMSLSNIEYLMKENGILYISFHFIYPVHNPVEQDYLRYTPAGVKKLLKETGFEILEMKPRLMKYSGLWRDFYTSEGMRPTKEYDKYKWVGCLIKAKKI